MFWSTCADTRNLAVIQCGMSVSRVEEIMRSLHFADNAKLPANDKIYKARPMFGHFHKLFTEFAHPLPMIWAVDEAMEPYYGNNGLKQFIKGKPVRFGSKFWCLCSAEGYLVSFKLHEGKDSGYEKSKAIGESVVHTLTQGAVPPNSSGFIDNFSQLYPFCNPSGKPM